MLLTLSCGAPPGAPAACAGCAARRSVFCLFDSMEFENIRTHARHAARDKRHSLPAHNNTQSAHFYLRNWPLPFSL